MKAFILLVPALVCSAQEVGLAPQLARAGSVSTDQLRALQARLVLDPAPAARKTYYEKYLEYQLATRVREKDPKAARALVERAIKSLEGSRDPECMALLGAFLGLKIGFEPMSGMTLSPRAVGLFDEALALAPASPRVRLLKATHILHMPAFVGGGAKEALPLMEQAARLAEQEKPSADPWTPAWGKVESLSWLALTRFRAGQFEAANQAADKALRVDPEYGFLVRVVIPEIRPKEL